MWAMTAIVGQSLTCPHRAQWWQMILWQDSQYTVTSFWWSEQTPSLTVCLGPLGFLRSPFRSWWRRREDEGERLVH